MFAISTQPRLSKKTVLTRGSPPVSKRRPFDQSRLLVSWVCSFEEVVRDHGRQEIGVSVSRGKDDAVDRLDTLERGPLFFEMAATALMEKTSSQPRTRKVEMEVEATMTKSASTNWPRTRRNWKYRFPPVSDIVSACALSGCGSTSTFNTRRTATGYGMFTILYYTPQFTRGLSIGDSITLSQWELLLPHSTWKPVGVLNYKRTGSVRFAGLSDLTVCRISDRDRFG